MAIYPFFFLRAHFACLCRGRLEGFTGKRMNYYFDFIEHAKTNKNVLVTGGQADGWQALSPTVARQISVSRFFFFFPCRWAQINVVGT